MSIKPTELTKQHTVYRTNEQQCVPGVTTVIEQLGWNKRVLINWANNLGLNGIDASKYKDETASIGKLAHALILNSYKQTAMDLTLYSEYETNAAKLSLNKLKVWEQNKTIEPVLLEQPLVSDLLLFGGTPDFYGKVDGKLTLLDYKSGGGIYLEHWIQVAGGYFLLLEENGHKVEQIIILNIPCTPLTPFQEQLIPMPLWGVCGKIFMNCLENYKLQKVLTRVNN